MKRLVLLLAAAAMTGPLLAQDKGNVVISLSNEIQNAIAPAFEKYTKCLSKEGIAGLERALIECSAVRTSAIVEANVALSRDPAWPDPAKSKAEVNRAFDTHDRNQRAIAAVIEQQIAGHGQRLGK